MKKLLLLLLVTLQPAWGDTMPDLSWLDHQSALSITLRNENRTVYRVSGKGSALFYEFQRDLLRQQWEISRLQTNGQWYAMHATRGHDAVDVTLQEGEPGTLTVVNATSHARDHDARPSGVTRAVEGDHLEQTLSCSGEAVMLNGSHCVITLQGTCGEVRVSGSHNHLFIDASVPTITVSGDDNLIRWRTARNRNRPVLRNTGRANDLGND